MQDENFIVQLPYEAPPGLLASVSEDLGVIVQPWQPRGVNEVEVVLTGALSPLLTSLMKAGAEEGWRRMRGAVMRLRHPTPPPTPTPPVLRLMDSATDVAFVIDDAAEGDPRALPALAAMNRRAYREGIVLHWQRTSGSWRSDETV